MADKKKYTYGLGRRKAARATARLYKGKGETTTRHREQGCKHVPEQFDGGEEECQSTEQRARAEFSLAEQDACDRVEEDERGSAGEEKICVIE